MKKTYMMALFCVFSLVAFSQTPADFAFLVSEKEKNKTTSRSGDFYVVDSLYCYSHDPATGVQTPTERQYNLEFSATGEVLKSRKEKFLPWPIAWRYSELQTAIYDDEENLIEQTTQAWDTLAQSWVNHLRSQYTPNQNGDYTAVLNQKWDAASGNWTNVDRLILAYDPDSGKAVSLEQELWDAPSNTWKKNLRILYAINLNGTMASTLFQLWEQAGYKSVSRTFLSYHPVFTTKNVEEVTQIAVSGTPNWLNSSRFTNAYDPNGNRTETISFLWNTPDSSWLNQNRTLNNYDAAQHLTLKTELYWNGSIWVNFFQTNNVYDANGNQTHFDVSQWLAPDWAKLSSCDFYWRFHHEVEAQEVFEDALCQIPNPLTRGQSFYCENLPNGQRLQLRLFDLSGKAVFSTAIDNQNFINIAAPLPDGLYLLVVLGEKGILSRQKIVLRQG